MIDKADNGPNAATPRSDIKALSTVRDALRVGAAIIDVTYKAINIAAARVDEIKTKVVSAREPGIDRDKIQTEIVQLQLQLQRIADSATYSGENWLSVDSSAASYNATKSIVSSFSRFGGLITINTIDINAAGIKLYDASAAATATAMGIIDGLRLGATGAISATGTFAVSTIDISVLSDDAADLAIIEGYVQGTESAIAEMASAASELCVAMKRIYLQNEFVVALMDAITKGAHHASNHVNCQNARGI